MITIEEAFEFIESYVECLPIREVGLEQSVGKRLASQIIADVNSPPHDKTVMDGFAVRAQDIGKFSEFKVLETIIAGNVPEFTLTPGTASRK